MTERPTIEIGGATHQRRDGTWVTMDQIRVPAAKATTIDALAQQNQELWAFCMALDAIECPRPPRVTKRRSQKKRSTPPKPKALVCDLSADREVRLSADLRQGWRTHPKTYGFVGEEMVEGPIGQSLRIHVQLLTKTAVDCPEFASVRSDQRGIRVSIEGQCLKIAITMFSSDGSVNPELGWSEASNGKRMVFRNHWQSSIQLVGKSQLGGCIENTLSILIVEQFADAKPAPIERDWESPFVSGGLPSLGKRHS